MREIHEAVMEKYPITDEEKKCWQEKQRRDQMREIYKNRLIEQREKSYTAKEI